MIERPAKPRSRTGRPETKHKAYPLADRVDVVPFVRAIEDAELIVNADLAARAQREGIRIDE